METVLRPEPAVKGASWPSRLLDGLGGLGGWLVGPDPGLNRLRIVLCAMLTIVISYDIVPADDHGRSAAAPDPAGEPASSQSAAADGGEPDR